MGKTLVEKLVEKNKGQVQKRRDTKDLIEKWKHIFCLHEWDIDFNFLTEKEMNGYLSTKTVDYNSSVVKILLDKALSGEKLDQTIVFELLSLRLSAFSEIELDEKYGSHNLSILVKKLIALEEAATDPNTVERVAKRWKHAYDLKAVELEKAYDKLSELKADNTMLGQANDIALATITGKGEVKKLKEDNNNLKNKYQELHDKYDALCKENAKLKNAIKKSAAENNNNHLDKKKIEKIIDYYADGHSARETARHFQVSDSTVRKYVKQAGIHRSNKKLSETDKNQIIDLYKSGYSYRKIARHFGVNHASIRDVIKKNAA